jgi:cytoskeletal protein CcmA (bactofilin family)
MRFQLDLDPSRHPAHPPAVAAADTPPADAGRALVAIDARPQRVPVLTDSVVSASPDTTPAWFTAEVVADQTLVVPAGAQLRGDCSAHSVCVWGEVRGRVRATGGMLVVMPGGRVRGSVEGAAAVVIAGQVTCERGRDAVVAHGRLDLAASARISGNVRHDVVAVYRGAKVDGRLVSVHGVSPRRAMRFVWPWS